MIERWIRPLKPVGLVLLAASVSIVRPQVGRSQEPLRDNRAARRVDIQKVTTLRFQNLTVAPNIETRAFHMPDGGWGAISPVFDGIFPLFSATGTPSGTLGRPGPGPGEFKNPVFAIVVGNQTWVVDPGNNRITAFGAKGSVLGDRTLPGRVIWAQPTADGSALLLSGFFGSPSGTWHTVGRVTIKTTDDVFGGDTGANPNGLVQQHLAAQTPSGEIWAVARAGGRIQILRSHNLGHVASTRLPEDLSQPEAHPPLYSSNEPPAPQVDGVMVDSNGILWIVMVVADAHWRSGLNLRTDPKKIFDTLLLAVSAPDRAIVGVRRLDQNCRAMAAGLISCPNEDAATVDIWRLSIER